MVMNCDCLKWTYQRKIAIPLFTKFEYKARWCFTTPNQHIKWQTLEMGVSSTLGCIPIDVVFARIMPSSA